MLVKFITQECKRNRNKNDNNINFESLSNRQYILLPGENKWLDDFIVVTSLSLS